MNIGFLLVLGLLPLSGIPDAHAVERRITMGGECNLESQPDRASVVFTAEHQASDAKIAIQKATAQHERLRAKLKEAKIRGLELSSVEYSVQEVMAWENNRNVSKGYSCRIGLKAVTPGAGELAEAIAIAGNNDIRNTHGMQMFLSDEKGLEEKKRCISVALKNAREKAEHAVKALGARLGAVEQIVERGSSSPGPIPMLREGLALKGAAMAAPTLEAPTQTVHYEVEATFSIDI